jgi:hypothetical protein
VDAQQTLSSFHGEYHQFDLAALDEINRLAWFAGGVDVVMPGDLYGAAISRLAFQGIAQVPLELVRLKCLLTGHSYTLGINKLQILLLEEPSLADHQALKHLPAKKIKRWPLILPKFGQRMPNPDK